MNNPGPFTDYIFFVGIVKGFWETSSDDDDAITDSQESSNNATDSHSVDNLQSDLTSANNDVQSQNKTENIGESENNASKSNDIVNNTKSMLSEKNETITLQQVHVSSTNNNHYKHYSNLSVIYYRVLYQFDCLFFLIRRLNLFLK